MKRIAKKFKRNAHWIKRYPLVRLSALFKTVFFEKKHIIFTIADHFEPGWSDNGLLPLVRQHQRLDEYIKTAKLTSELLRDIDGTKFRHTNFYPAEQYDAGILDKLAEMQADGLGEVEVHLHHGVEKPDTAENLRKTLVDFRDVLAEKHECLSRWDGVGDPAYAFVHGNLALANSAGGRFCGVDNEMSILRDTGCYADFTLPSAPDRSQVSQTNSIYEYAGDPDLAVPHERGKNVENNGKLPRLPLIFTGPLMLNWAEKMRGFPAPRLDDGVLAANQPLEIARFDRWRSANIIVDGKSDWIFVKLYCHGFFDNDQSQSIGDDAVKFFSEVIENGIKNNSYDIYFASAREAFNMVLAAIDGKRGRPGQYRDYRLKTIMDS